MKTKVEKALQVKNAKVINKNKEVTIIHVKSMEKSTNPKEIKKAITEALEVPTE